MERQINRRERAMTIGRTLKLALLLSTIVTGGARPAMAQACSHEGPVVICDDGRRGLLSGDAIIWPDGTRSSASPHPKRPPVRVKKTRQNKKPERFRAQACPGLDPE